MRWLGCTWTRAEVSQILSALANYQPLCCNNGWSELITANARKLDRLREWAYERLSCSHVRRGITEARDVERMDAYLTRTIEGMGFSSVGARALTDDERGAGRTEVEAARADEMYQIGLADFVGEANR